MHGQNHVKFERYLGEAQILFAFAFIARSSGWPVACCGDMRSKIFGRKSPSLRDYFASMGGWIEG